MLESSDSAACTSCLTCILSPGGRCRWKASLWVAMGNAWFCFGQAGMRGKRGLQRQIKRSQVYKAHRKLL